MIEDPLAKDIYQRASFDMQIRPIGFIPQALGSKGPIHTFSYTDNSYFFILEQNTSVVPWDPFFQLRVYKTRLRADYVYIHSKNSR